MAYDRTEYREISSYGYKIKIVAHEGGANDWAAYAENSYTRERGNSWELVQSNGDKLFRDDATKLFPDWDEQLSWRP